MSMLRVLVLATVVGLLSTVPADAQRAKRKRVSPHETVSEVIDGNKVSVTYGRPYSKNPRGTDIRKIWGSLVPYGKAWRLGADEETCLSNSMITTAIRRAQEKIESQVARDLAAESIDDWFKYNLPE